MSTDYWRHCKLFVHNIFIRSQQQRFTDFLNAWNLIQKRHQRRCFLVNIAKFLRTAFSIVHLCWLLLWFPESSIQTVYPLGNHLYPLGNQYQRKIKKSISVYYTVNEWSPFLIDFFRALIFRKGTGFREGWHSRAYFPLGGTYFKTVPSQKFINAKADCPTTVFLASNILLYTFLEDISAREFLSHDNLLFYVLTLVI